MLNFSKLSDILADESISLRWQIIVRLVILAIVFVSSIQYFSSRDFNQDTLSNIRLKKISAVLRSSYENQANTLMAIEGQTVKNRGDDDVGLFVLTAAANLVKTKLTGSPIYPDNNNIWNIQSIPFFVLLILLAFTIKSLPLFFIGAVSLALGIQEVSMHYLMNNRLAPAVAFIFAISLALDFCFSKRHDFRIENLVMGISGIALGLYNYVRADNFYIVIPIMVLAVAFKTCEIKTEKLSYKLELIPLLTFFFSFFIFSRLLFNGFVYFLEYYDGVEYFDFAFGHSAWHPLLMGFGVGTTPNYENICWIDSCGYTVAGQLNPGIRTFAEYVPVAKNLFKDILLNNPWIFFESIAYKFGYYLNSHRIGLGFSMFMGSLGLFLSTTLPFMRNPKVYI